MIKVPCRTNGPPACVSVTHPITKMSEGFSTFSESAYERPDVGSTFVLFNIIFRYPVAVVNDLICREVSKIQLIVVPVDCWCTALSLF
jgi:hypothetical protein